MKFLITPIFAALSLSLHADPAVLGKIGEIELDSNEVREAIAGLEAEQHSTLSRDPAAVGQYVRALLIQRLVLQKALEEKWEQKPEVIARLVRARETALTESYLENVSKVPADYPSASELEAAYLAARPGLLQPESFRLAQIFIAVPENANKKEQAEAKEKAHDLAERLVKSPEDFGTIAASESEEPVTKQNKGEIGWLTLDQLQPDIRDVLPDLAPGGISRPVRLKDGWHLIKLLETREARTPELSEVREELTAQLRAERLRQNRQDYLAKLLKEHPLAINEIELSRLLNP